jgi:hypothetical protein
LINVCSITIAGGKYVDDILIFRINLDTIKEVKNLFNILDMKTLGAVDIILNIELLREDKGEDMLL